MMLPTASKFWQYMLYADIRGGSQDLCKFSVDFMPVPWWGKVIQWGIENQMHCLLANQKRGQQVDLVPNV